MTQGAGKFMYSADRIRIVQVPKTPLECVCVWVLGGVKFHPYPVLFTCSSIFPSLLFPAPSPSSPPHRPAAAKPHYVETSPVCGSPKGKRRRKKKNFPCLSVCLSGLLAGCAGKPDPVVPRGWDVSLLMLSLSETNFLCYCRVASCSSRVCFFFLFGMGEGPRSPILVVPCYSYSSSFLASGFGLFRFG